MKKTAYITLIFTLLLLTVQQTHAATPIMGRAVLTAKQMETFVKKIHPDAPTIAKIFLEEGATEGVRGDLAYVQSIKETGYFRFGGDVLPEQNNFGGIGATNVTAKGKGAWFETPREGIRAQIQHLKAYASTDPLNEELVDPRFHLVRRGSAPNIEDLNGKWAVPGTTYGQDIVQIYNKIKETDYTNKLSKLREKLRQKKEEGTLSATKERLRERLQTLRSNKRPTQ